MDNEEALAEAKEFERSGRDSSKKDLRQAQQNFTSALKIYKRILGENDEQCIDINMSLVIVWARLEKFDNAWGCYTTLQESWPKMEPGNYNPGFHTKILLMCAELSETCISHDHFTMAEDVIKGSLTCLFDPLSILSIRKHVEQLIKMGDSDKSTAAAFFLYGHAILHNATMLSILWAKNNHNNNQAAVWYRISLELYRQMLDAAKGIEGSGLEERRKKIIQDYKEMLNDFNTILELCDSNGRPGLAQAIKWQEEENRKAFGGDGLAVGGDASNAAK